MENLTLTDPSTPEGQIKGLRSSVAKALLRAGEWFRIQGFRWKDGRFTVRGGTQLQINVPVSGASLVDWWTGDLNGTNYIVGVFLINSKYETWHSTDGASWTRLNEVGGWYGTSTAGDTRMTNLTGRIAFCAVKAPAGFLGGSVTPARDILLVSNGQDYIRVWDPGRTVSVTLSVTGAADAAGVLEVTFGASHDLNDSDTIVISGVLGNVAANGSFWVDKTSATKVKLYRDEALSDPVISNGTYTSGGTAVQSQRFAMHRPVTVPADASNFSQKGTFYYSWPVRSNTTKAYAAAGVVNQARFKLSDGPYDVYTGTNAVIVWTWQTTAASGDIATVYVTATGGTSPTPLSPIQLGKGLVIFTEDITAAFGADTMFSCCKIEVCAEDVVYGSTTTWSTVYDPFSSNDYERKFFTGLLENNLDPALYSDPPRRMWFFPTDHLATASKLIFHIRFTRGANAPTPSVNSQIAILAICGAGDIPGLSEFTLSYEDEPGKSESPGFTANDTSNGAPLSEIGGPRVFASVQPIFKVPIIDGAFYDYLLNVKNSAGASTIVGGLNGEPSRFNIYLRAPNENTATYFYSVKIYDPGNDGTSLSWGKIESTNNIAHHTGAVTKTYAFDWTYRDNDRPAPSGRQISIPPAYAMAFAGNRLFVGNIYDVTNSTRQNSDLYFSAFGFFNRLQNTFTNDEAGSRNRYAGEIIQFLGATSAGAQAATDTMLWTDKECKILGGSGSLAGKGIAAQDLSAAFTVAKKGTRSFRSIVENDGAWAWLDQFGQFQRIKDGQLTNLSRLWVDDKPKNVPSGMRGKVTGEFYEDAFIWSYAIASGTTNTRLLGFNDVMEVWEFDDLPPVSAERLLVWFDSSANGSGQKLLIMASTGKTYWFDKPGALDLDDPISCRLTSRAFAANGNESVRIGGVYMDATAQDQDWTFDRYYESQTGLSRSQMNLTQGRVWDGGRPEVVSGFADDRGERGRSAYLDCYGLLTAGSVIDHLGIEIVRESGDDAPDASV